MSVRGFYVYGPASYGVGCLVIGAPAPESMLAPLDEDDEPLVWLYQLLAPTWNEAMRDYHEIQGWEPYKPMPET